MKSLSQQELVQAILEILKAIDLKVERDRLSTSIKETKSKVTEERNVKRLKLMTLL